ncbi:MAG: YgaP family membrane protein [Turicibacter sp.]
MCKNVGRLDAYLRISAGLMLVSLGIMKKKGWIAAIGSMKVAEGVTRYCPVMDLCHCTTMSDEEILEDALCMGASDYYGDDYSDDCDYDCDCDFDCDCDEDCDCEFDCECDEDCDCDLEDFEEEGI